MNPKGYAQVFMRQAIADLLDDYMGLRERLSEFYPEYQLDQLTVDVEDAMRSAQVIITWDGA